jgi:hypothetical protein
MNATANSNTINPINIHIIISIDNLVIKLFPSRLINRCPAIIFALRRTASDPGRIIFLIDSINTIKGISG